jgi:hypothetical protein
MLIRIIKLCIYIKYILSLRGITSSVLKLAAGHWHYSIIKDIESYFVTLDSLKDVNRGGRR